MTENTVPLYHIYTYTDVDRAFWAEHLEDWVPKRIIDAHVHFNDPKFQIETVTEEMLKASWVTEVCPGKSNAADTEVYTRTTFPNREVSLVAFGHIDFGWEIEGSNEDIRAEGIKRGWYSLMMVRPTWVAEQVDWWLSKPGVLGAKPYYTMIGYDRTGSNAYINAGIFDFVPHHQLEVLDQRAAWLTLHVPKVDRLGNPDNLRDIAELRKRYPRVKLVIAHFGRSYTLPHAEEGLLPLADDPGILFDVSAVLNPAVHELALKHIGPDRILYGTDNPYFYLRGRRQWEGRTYINRTSHPFHFNKNREAPEIEARYTIYMYEALKAIKDSCNKLGLGADAVQKLFYSNARGMIEDILSRKGETPLPEPGSVSA
jgi:hypothetical protein